jgi:hypothetical protein
MKCPSSYDSRVLALEQGYFVYIELHYVIHVNSQGTQYHGCVCGDDFCRRSPVAVA